MQLLATNFGSPHGVTVQDGQVRFLWNLTYWFAIPLGLIVYGLIFWCVIRYRARKNDNRKPDQTQYHIPLEATYTIVPVLIVIVVFIFSFRAENRVDAVSKHPALVVNVTGFQWGWRFTYPNGHQQVGDVATDGPLNDKASLPVLYLPAHETVQLNLRSADVYHGFYVKEFLFKRALIPGIHNTVDFNINKTGHFLGACSQFCGEYHAYMRFMVDVMPIHKFNSWLAAQKPGSITYAGSGK